VIQFEKAGELYGKEGLKMLLQKVTIHKYKSFIVEQSFEVEDGITRIVGKNESGKTALLEAMAKTNYFENSDSFKFDKTMDYPRGELAKVQAENPKVVTCNYYIPDLIWNKLESDLGKDVLTNRSFSKTTLYDNNATISGVNVNFDNFKKFLLSKFSLAIEKQPILEGCKSFEELLSVSGEIVEVNEFLLKIDNSAKAVAYQWENTLEKYIYHTYLSPNLPKFWYFSDYFNIPCRLNINSLVNGNSDNFLTGEEYSIVKALLDLSGLNATDIQDESNFEAFKAKLESTSNSITDEMFEYWSTNENLEIKFDIEHAPNSTRYLNIRVYNQKHRVTLPLKNRSKGFIWFFSFLVWFSKIQGKKESNYVLLLDEPGLSLHAAAQKDLLRFIDEKLAVDYQVLYTTHSPFMVDSLKLHEVRTVYDTQDRKIGSVVSDALEEKDSDTLFPLQAALGYTIAQNLYVSKKNLLVEGISDLVYLNHFSVQLKNAGRTGLADDITIVPVGGADKIATFISLMRGNELGSVCLLDTFTDQSAQSRLDKMVAQKIIQSNKIIFYHAILNVTFADIEDMFTTDEYLSLFNGAFSHSIPSSDIDKSKPIMNQLKRLNGNKNFNHYSPANYMIKNISSLSSADVTLQHFEDLFVKVNSLF